MLRLRLRLRSFETLLSGLELRLLETDFSLQFPFSTTSGWWLPLLERDRLFTEVGDCDFSLDEFKGVSDSADLLLLFELLSCGECDVDRLLDRDFRGEECAFDSTELRDLERLDRSTALEGDGDRSPLFCILCWIYIALGLLQFIGNFYIRVFNNCHQKYS